VAYVITERCQHSADDAVCVEVCPVDCIHPRPDEPAFATTDQLYINPEVCIHCGSCARVCPARSIFADDDLPAHFKRFLAKNESRYHSGGLFVVLPNSPSAASASA
jgi:ferredoxin--NADP+ reductase